MFAEFGTGQVFLSTPLFHLVISFAALRQQCVIENAEHQPMKASAGVR